MKMLAIMLLVSATAFAQDLKIGYTSIDLIVFNMPEMTGINADLSVYQSQLASQVNTKQTEIQNKINEFQTMSQQPNANQLILQERQNEIIKLQDDLQAFSQKAEEAYIAKQNESYQPVYTKVGNAIEEVRKEQSITLVINSRTANGAPIILAADDALDITKAVLDKLGVDLPAAATAAADSTGSGN